MLGGRARSVAWLGQLVARLVFEGARGRGSCSGSRYLELNVDFAAVIDGHIPKAVGDLVAAVHIVAGTGMVMAGRGCVHSWSEDYMTIVLGSSILLPDLSKPS